jgi:hypothetical protein
MENEKTESKNNRKKEILKNLSGCNLIHLSEEMLPFLF